MCNPGEKGLALVSRGEHLPAFCCSLMDLGNGEIGSPESFPWERLGLPQYLLWVVVGKWAIHFLLGPFLFCFLQPHLPHPPTH